MKPSDPRKPVGYTWLAQYFGHQGEDCVIWPFSCCTPGYGLFQYQQKRHMAHRFMCEHHHGPAPQPGYHAAHSCGNRRCVNPRHLSWKSPSDNQLDRRAHGTHNKTTSKITAMQADQIRKLKGIETSVETAARYGITESNVRLIQDGKTWAGRVNHWWTPEEDARLRRLISEGKNFVEIAQEIDQPLSSVSNRAYRIGLRSGQPCYRKSA